MAKGKSTYQTWYCSECKKPGETTTYNKRSDKDRMNEKKKHCPQCRSHTVHKAKDTKS